MLKVASRSWLEAVRPAAAREGTEPVHVHFLNPSTLEMVAGLRAFAQQHQTIANVFLLRDVLRKGAAARAAIDSANARGEMVRVITGMRDPVARSLSLVHFFGDFYGDTSRKLDRARGGDGTDTARAVIEFWQAVLAGIEPADSFGRYMSFLIGAYRNWFTDELAAAFGVDLGQEAFPADAGARCLAAGRARILLYRVEDLAPQAPGHDGLLTQAAAFLGVPAISLPEVNTAASRRSFARFEAARAALRLPPDMLDAIYGQPIIRTFYAPAEIEVFRRRWSGLGA